MKSLPLIPQPKKSPIISKIRKKSGTNPDLRIEVAIRANSLEAVDIVDQKKNTLMAWQNAKQRMLSVKSVVRKITSLSYVEAPDMEVVGAKIEAAHNPKVEVAMVDKLNLQV